MSVLLDCLERLLRSENLPTAVCTEVLPVLLAPDTNPLQVAAFLVLLRQKGETSDELVGLINALRAHALQLPLSIPLLDIVGTGGDHQMTVNISTGSAILAASCGVKVAKHGNRRVSSAAGSADVLEALGVATQLLPWAVAECIEEIGIGFCFSPLFYRIPPAFRALRASLGLPTVFNLLGPLLHPGQNVHLLLGVADPASLPKMAAVLAQRQSPRSILVHSNGMDEITCLAPMTVTEVNRTHQRRYVLDPKAFGFPYCILDDLRGHDAKTNAQLLWDVFQGKSGGLANSLVLNAAVGLYLYGQTDSIQAAVPIVQKALQEGKTATLLTQWINKSHALCAA